MVLVMMVVQATIVVVVDIKMEGEEDMITIEVAVEDINKAAINREDMVAVVVVEDINKVVDMVVGQGDTEVVVMVVEEEDTNKVVAEVMVDDHMEVGEVMVVEEEDMVAVEVDHMEVGEVVVVIMAEEVVEVDLSVVTLLK